MGKRDPRVDAYISRSADFAKPILTHIRDVVHAACPPVDETLKWSVPWFTYNGMLCGMAAFKQHCMFGFWKGSLIVDKTGKSAGVGMGELKVARVEDLPSDKNLTGYIKQAMKLNDEGVKTARPAKPKAKKPLAVPASLTKALGKNKRAMAAFEAFSPSHRREYIEWIAEAKSDETRERRIDTAVKWMTEGKARNWKYMKR